MAFPYVKLAPEWSNGVLADIKGGTGWALAGKDIEKTDDLSADVISFIDEQISLGRIVSATETEYRSAHLPSSRVLVEGSHHSLQAQIKDLGKWSVGDAIRTIKVRPGAYLVSSPIELPSGVHLDLRGVKIKLASGSNCDIITNADWDNGNSDITIEGGFLDGNRTGQVSVVGDGPGQSLISMVNVERFVARGIRGTSPFLHGIDMSNTLYYEQGDEPGCTGFLIDDCGFSDFGDDAITTHQSHNGLISNCFATDSAATYSTSSNAVEIDDGSSDIAIVGGWASDCGRGILVKGHSNNKAARNITVTGFVTTDCSFGFSVEGDVPFHESGPGELVTFTSCVATRCTAGVSVIHYGSAEFVGCTFDECANLFSNTDPTDATATAVIKMTGCQIHATRTVLDNPNIGTQVYSGCVWRGYTGTAAVVAQAPDIEFNNCVVTDGVNNFTGALVINPGADRCKVVGGSFKNPSGAGIRVAGGDNVVITGATMSGSSTAGGLLVSAATPNGLVIANNVSVGGSRGFNFDSTGGTAIVKHNIAKGSAAGIDGAPSGWTISENITA